MQNSQFTGFIKENSIKNEEPKVFVEEGELKMSVAKGGKEQTNNRLGTKQLTSTN